MNTTHIDHFVFLMDEQSMEYKGIRNRHGPSARGRPLNRVKPPDFGKNMPAKHGLQIRASGDHHIRGKPQWRMYNLMTGADFDLRLNGKGLFSEQ